MNSSDMCWNFSLKLLKSYNNKWSLVILGRNKYFCKSVFAFFFRFCVLKHPLCNDRYSVMVSGQESSSKKNVLEASALISPIIPWQPPYAGCFFSKNLFSFPPSAHVYIPRYTGCYFNLLAFWQDFKPRKKGSTLGVEKPLLAQKVSSRSPEYMFQG
jgi:hypothetical protein